MRIWYRFKWIERNEENNVDLLRSCYFLIFPFARFIPAPLGCGDLPECLSTVEGLTWLSGEFLFFQEQLQLVCNCGECDECIVYQW